MPRIRVVGSVGLDRIWHLDRALRPGARIRCARRFLRLGGGAANTGAVLTALGHQVEIVARVRRDAAGAGLLERLRAGGLDDAAIERVEGVTQPGEIFVQPDGERTLISTGGAPAPLPAGLFGDAAPWTYFNIARLRDPGALAALRDRTCLIAQLPLDLGEPRPAHVLIASRSDVGDPPAAELWRLRRALDGAALRHIVVTDGAGGAEIVGRDGAARLGAEPIAELRDSIGAGDFFAAGLIDGFVQGLAAADAVAHGQLVARRFLVERPAILAQAFDVDEEP